MSFLMGRQATARWLKTVLFSGATLFMQGCATTYDAAYFFEQAAATSDCATKVNRYMQIPWYAVLYKDNPPTSEELSLAIAGLKATAPTCASDQQIVTESLLRSTVHLREMKHPEAESIAELYFDYLESHPQAYTDVGKYYYDVDVLAENPKADRQEQFFNMVIERGLWNAAALDKVKPFWAVDPEKTARLEKLRMTLLSIEQVAQSLAPREFTMGESYQLLSHGHYTDDTDRRAARYLRAYAEGARQQGDETRAAIALQLAKEKDIAYAGKVQEDAQWQAKQAASSRSTAAFMSLLGAAASVAAATDTGNSSLTTSQGASSCDAMPGNTISSYISKCHCRNGQTSTTTESDGDVVVSCKLPNGLNTSCKFLTDGTRSCGMESR